MSMTDHSRRQGRRVGRGDTVTARVVRVRNVCVLHAAAHLGLATPTDAELEALPAELTLTQSVRWLRAKQASADSDATGSTRRHADSVELRAGSILVRVVSISLIIAGALALTYGKAQ